jgi:hypothetical protein
VSFLTGFDPGHGANDEIMIANDSGFCPPGTGPFPTKLTKEFAEVMRLGGLIVDRKAADWLRTFPPLTTIIARKPPSGSPAIGV